MSFFIIIFVNIITLYIFCLSETIQLYSHQNLGQFFLHNLSLIQKKFSDQLRLIRSKIVKIIFDAETADLGYFISGNFSNKYFRSYHHIPLLNCKKIKKTEVSKDESQVNVSRVSSNDKLSSDAKGTAKLSIDYFVPKKKDDVLSVGAEEDSDKLQDVEQNSSPDYHDVKEFAPNEIACSTPEVDRNGNQNLDKVIVSLGKEDTHLYILRSLMARRTFRKSWH